MIMTEKKKYQYVVTTTYAIHAPDAAAADAGLAWILEHGEFSDHASITDQVVARFDPPKTVPGDAWYWNDNTSEWENANER
jgi:hypothetical protein